MRRLFHQPACGSRFLEFFFQFNPNASSELTQIWTDSSVCIDGAMLKILALCVSWFARKLAHRQTDGRTDGHGKYISVFFAIVNGFTLAHPVSFGNPGRRCRTCQLFYVDDSVRLYQFDRSTSRNNKI